MPEPRFREGSHPPQPPGRRVGVLAITLAAFMAGCGTPGYYWQAVRGHTDLMAQRIPVQRLVEDLHTSTELKVQLLLARQMCAFAESDLALPSNRHYQHYADLGRPHVVWNIYAAPEFSLEPKTWWYPFVARLDYRGYFEEASARRYAARLDRRGWETHVEGASAYSTLGWFRDPLLNTFLWSGEAALAETLFHELAHQRVFVPGDTEFNEAFATVVGREGTSRWLRSQGREEALRTFENSVRAEARFVTLALAARAELEALYARYPDAASRDGQRHTIRRARQAILNRLQHDLDSLMGHATPRESAGEALWNNARLNSLATYHEWVPAFESLLKVRGGCLASFYGAVEELARLPATRRIEALRERAGIEPDAPLARP